VILYVSSQNEKAKGEQRLTKFPLKQGPSRACEKSNNHLARGSPAEAPAFNLMRPIRRNVFMRRSQKHHLILKASGNARIRGKGI
jgi:hypothetical protein